MRGVDSITTEVIRYELVSAVEEIKRIFKRTTTLAVLYELNDFGISAFDASYRLIADAPGLPIFSGTLNFCVKSCVEQVGVENLAPGDVLTTTIPFDTGGQPVDAALVAPVFAGDRIMAYTALKAHAGDLGAIDPYPTSSTDMFQEGLMLPAVWLYRRGELVEEIVRLIKANSRIPQTTIMSFLAGASALRAGGRRIAAVVERYGYETFQAAIEEIIAHGEKIARAAVEAIPEGTWEVVDWMDNNGVDNQPVKLVVKVTVRGGDLIVDLSDSAPQQGGPINSPYPGTVSACRYVIKALTTPRLPANEGHFRPLHVIAPRGTIFHPVPPAPTFLYGWTELRLLDLIPAALAEAIPNCVAANSGGDIAGFGLFYYDQATGRGDMAGGADAVGLGATCSREGQSALIHNAESCCCNIPVEVQESKLPVLIERYELRTDSGGPGKFRGGLGMRKDYQTLAPATAIAMMERTCASPVEGIAGGRRGAFNRAIFYVGSPAEVVGGKKIAQLIAGDKVSVQGGGGAGWGEPLERDPECVLADVRDAYVSVAAAERDYGVMIRALGGDFVLDLEVTRALRESRRGNLPASVREGGPGS
jgi:N-methylhydantoinase B